MTIQFTRRHVGWVWYWIAVAVDAAGFVVAYVMDVDYNRSVRELFNSLEECYA